MKLQPVGPAGRTLLLALLVTVLGPALSEAVYVSPTAVFMDARSRDASITVGNAGESPEEATIELKYGFPDADSAGTPFIRFLDDPGPEMGSAADWIRPFPQRVRLEPGAQQVVRLLARPPENLPDGEYWTRMIVSGRGSTVNLPTRDSGLHVGVGLEIRLVTSVTFRKGRVTTGVTIRSMNVEVEGDSLALWAGLARTGNGAWLGTADIELLTARGGSVRKWSVPMSVHFPLTRRFAFPVGFLQPGDYRVRLRLRSERPDLPTERVLGAPTVADSIAVRVN